MKRPQINNSENLLPISGIFDYLIELVDNNIENYPQFLIETQTAYYDSKLILKEKIEQEDDLTITFSRFFNFLENTDYYFENQSKTPETNATTDIGVIAKKYSKHKVLCFIESKRLPTPQGSGRQETEYVAYKNSKKQGGIERFKSEKHGGKEKLSFSIMLGYIQDYDFNIWLEKVNGWIDFEILSKSNENITWEQCDKLNQDILFKKNNISKYYSSHKRVSLGNIKIIHYWVNMVPKSQIEPSLTTIGSGSRLDTN